MRLVTVTLSLRTNYYEAFQAAGSERPKDASEQR